VNTGEGNKIVLKGYTVEPIVTEYDGTYEISQGEPCKDEDPTDDTLTSAATRALAFGLPMFLGQKAGLPAMATALAAGFTAFAPSAFAQRLRAPVSSLKLKSTWTPRWKKLSTRCTTRVPTIPVLQKVSCHEETHNKVDHVKSKYVSYQ
jgi:hypothetical protein